MSRLLEELGLQDETLDLLGVAFDLADLPGQPYALYQGPALDRFGEGRSVGN